MHSPSPHDWAAVVGVVLIVLIFLVALPLWFFGRALRKAGFSGWWALLGLVPVVNIVMLWVFAFAEWPALPGSGSVPPRE
jgi:uncharacterized membrane protein YhaH (DUF805 family)